MQTLDEILSRWNSGEGKPYKGSLIDWDAYGHDGNVPPDDIGCMCAQGQVLHLMGGWTPGALKNAIQATADRETAKLLNISVAHAVLLRQVNDSIDGSPAIVLAHPEKILGDQAPIILAFWRWLDRMTKEDWLTQAAAWDAAWDTAWDTAQAAAWAAAWDAAQAAAGAAAWDAAWDAAWAAAGASNEIQGASIMRERGQPFFFLPMFGFADPGEIPLSR